MLPDYDRENLDKILNGHGDWFTAELLRAIRGSDALTREKFRRQFPEEVSLVEQKVGQAMAPVMGNLYAQADESNKARLRRCFPDLWPRDDLCDVLWSITAALPLRELLQANGIPISEQRT